MRYRIRRLLEFLFGFIFLFRKENSRRIPRPPNRGGGGLSTPYVTTRAPCVCVCVHNKVATKHAGSNARVISDSVRVCCFTVTHFVPVAPHTSSPCYMRSYIYTYKKITSSQPLYFVVVVVTILLYRWIREIITACVCVKFVRARARAHSVVVVVVVVCHLRAVRRRRRRRA